jgi:hypothetical protein
MSGKLIQLWVALSTYWRVTLDLVISSNYVFCCRLAWKILRAVWDP